MDSSKLSIDQKIALVGGKNFWSTQEIPEHGIPSIMLTDGPHGLRKQAGSADHLGLNESIPATCFPPATTLASTWDVDLMYQIGEALGDECLQENVQVLLGPGINIKRSPLCGRHFEYFSEDPVLTAQLAERLVKGIQSRGVGTSLKHFAVNSQETDRLQVSAEVDERTLREIYLKAFEQVVRNAKPRTVMCSYNSINGVPASQNHWLLTEVLRDEWGYTGTVISDWGAVIDRVDALKAGLDLEMPSSNGIGSAELRSALEDGRLDEETLDLAVDRMLSLIEQTSKPHDEIDVDFDAHHKLAEKAAATGAVLLKNESVLPLPNSDFVLIGELAKTPRFQGAGSSQVNPTSLSSILQAFEPDDVQFLPGYRLDGCHDEPLQTEAVAAATGKTAVVVLGLPPSFESEGFDRTSMSLPSNQIDVLAKIRAVAAKVVVVLANGSAIDIASWQHNADAILETWLGGQASGTATKKILLGELEPTGRLAETIPLKLSDVPAHANWPGENHRVLYGEEIFVGYRGYDHGEKEVAFPFGFGLGYTSFEYSNPSAKVVYDPQRQSATSSTDDFDTVVNISVDVTNTGVRRGTEIVQVYARLPKSSYRREVRSLVGFARAEVSAGETKRVTIPISQKNLCVWDNGWILEGGDYSFDIGHSSRQIWASTQVQLSGHCKEQVITAESTLREWSTNRDARAAIAQAVGEEKFSEIEAQMMILAADQPLNRMARLMGGALTHDHIELALSALASQSEKEN